MAAGLCWSGGEDRTVVAEGHGMLLQLEGGGNKKGGGGEAPTEVKPTTRGAELTEEGGAAVAPRQFPLRGGEIQRRKAVT
jgi:hypothetical protein